MIEDAPLHPHIAEEAANYIGQGRIAVHEALAIADSMPEFDEDGTEDWNRFEIYRQIIVAAHKIGQHEQADEIVSSLKFESDFPFYYELIADRVHATHAVKLAAEGQNEAAIDTLLAIDNQYEQADAFKDACETMADASAIDDALRLADSIRSESLRLSARIRIARTAGPSSPLWNDVLTEIQHYRDEYDEELGDSDWSYDKEGLYDEYIKAMAAVGNTEQAGRLCSDVTSPTIKVGAMTAVASAEGADSELWDTVASAFDEDSQQTNGWGYQVLYNRAAKTEVVQALARAGRISQAQEIAHSSSHIADTALTFSIDLACNNLEAARTDLERYSSLTAHGDFAIDEMRSQLAKAEIAGEAYTEADADIARIGNPLYQVSAILAKAEQAAARLAKMGVDPESFDTGLDTLPANMDIRKVQNIGAYSVKHWERFKDYDGATFARLAHGAARIAESYMSDRERVDFLRTLSKEFRNFRDNGMFDDGKHQAVLKHLGEAMVEAGDAGTTGVMLETLYANMGEATGLRLIKTLVETGNAKAGAAGINVLADPDTPDHAYQYLLHKLADTGYLDNELPGEIIVRQRGGFPAAASRVVLQRLHSDLGVQLDSTLLKWVINTVDASYGFEERPSGDMIMATIDERMDDVVASVRASLERFDSLPQDELLADLRDNSSDRALYFMLHGGRTRYSLIQHYNLSKFSQAVDTAAEIQARVDPASIRTRIWENAPDGWQQAMQERRRPDDSLVWNVEVGSSNKELRMQARSELGDVLGAQLNWLVADGHDAFNFGEMPDEMPALEPKVAKKIENLLGEQLTAIFGGAELDMTIGDFDKLKNNLLAQIRLLRQTAKQQKDPLAAEWKQILDTAQAEDPILSMRHIPAIISRTPSRSLHPKGADAEWLGHLTGLGTTIRDSQRIGPDKRQLTVRYLDGKDDFAELTRFADGAQCCFTSENTVGVVMDPTGKWRMRINRDPHWFVFSIEDTPPDAEQRTSSGFVFGSVAEVEGKPALALNGIYMQRKTDSAANAVLDGIVERFAKPMGVHSVVIASKHGGRFVPDHTKWQPAAGKELFRPRAILDRNGRPETDIYDDLGRFVNNTSKLDIDTWRHVL